MNNKAKNYQNHFEKVFHAASHKWEDNIKRHEDNEIKKKEKDEVKEELDGE